MTLQTRVQPPNGVRRTIGGAPSGNLPVNATQGQSPPIATPPPRNAAAAPLPAHQAPPTKVAAVNVLATLTTEQVAEACDKYTRGASIESILDSGISADQLEALTKRYTGMEKTRNEAIARNATVQRPAISPAAVTAPKPTPPKAPRPAAPIKSADAKPTYGPTTIAAARARLLNGDSPETVSKVLLLSPEGVAEIAAELAREQQQAQELRAQIVAHVGAGWDSGAVAEKFGVSLEFVNEVTGIEPTSAPDDAATEQPADESAASAEEAPAVDESAPSEPEPEAADAPAEGAKLELRRLTKKDHPEVFRLVAEGKTPQQIALVLGVREDAVARTIRQANQSGELTNAIADMEPEVDAPAGDDVEDDPAAEQLAPEPTATGWAEGLRAERQQAQAAALARRELTATPKQIATTFIAIGTAVERDPKVLGAIALVAHIERETGLTAEQIQDLLTWGGLR